MTELSSDLAAKLVRFAHRLIDQSAARIIIPAQQPAAGFWFGGGNMIEDADGILWLVGRYRNAGDSRTGLGKGARGLELALFRSTDLGETFTKTVSLSKTDLRVGSRDVLSIEGSALRQSADGFELFVSTEKTNIGYPAGLEDYLKPGTGVWTIDRLQADRCDLFAPGTLDTLLESADPQHLHTKDPFLYQSAENETQLGFCTHPFNWSSSNSAYAAYDQTHRRVGKPVFSFLARGTTWDVAIARATAMIDVPQLGAFSNHHVTLIFYDGGECLRDLDQHAAAVQRPRGYSCEELGGLAYCIDGKLNRIGRLSALLPLFISPYGTGCSRYVDVLATRRGLFATWQQSQTDGSQPLVINCLDWDEVDSLLS